MSMCDEIRGIPRGIPLRRWRRAGVEAAAMQQIIAMLGGARRADSRPSRTSIVVFEREVQRLLRMRAVRLREIPARYQVRLVTPTRTADSVVLGVPNADPRVQAVLEAACDPNRDLDDRDYQILSSIAQLGGPGAGGGARPQRRPSAGPPTSAAPLIGSTTAMQDLRSRIERVALTDFTVLIEGESGVGKELVARQVHELSRRHRGPFVAVNCAAVVESLLEAELFGIEERTATGVRGRRGKFENADGGTIFLDEVSDLSASAQAKLLRAIQEVAVERVGGHGVRRVNTRIVAATNRPLARLVEQRLFRSDLYYRLAGVEITVPPLRERCRRHHSSWRDYFLERHRYTRDADAVAGGAGGAARVSVAGQRAGAAAGDRTGGCAGRNRLASSWTTCRRRSAASSPRCCGRRSSVAIRFDRGARRYAQLVFERCGRNKRTACRVLDISYHTLRGYLRPTSKRRRPRPGCRSTTGRLSAWVRVHQRSGERLGRRRARSHDAAGCIWRASSRVVPPMPLLMVGAFVVATVASLRRDCRRTHARVGCADADSAAAAVRVLVGVRRAGAPRPLRPAADAR